MATTYTENYHLGKQENHADKFDMKVITDNMDKIDEALGDKADNSNLNANYIGLGNVENKSSAAIRSEITASNVTSALGFTPLNANSLLAQDYSVDDPLWANGMIDTTTHEIVESTKQCITKLMAVPDGEIYVGCNEGYQVQVVWYQGDTYDTLAAYRYTPMRSWIRNAANHCRVMVRKNPATDITPEEAYANVIITPHSIVEHSTTWASGSINSNTGAEATQNKRIRSSYIPIGNGIKITVPSGGKILPIMFKDQTPTVEYSVAFQTQSFTIYPQKDTQYVRLVFGYTAETEITDTGVHAQVRLDYVEGNAKWYALGDSITQGYHSVGSSIGVTPLSWVNVAANKTGLNLRNLGVGGSGFAVAGTQLDKLSAKDHVDSIDFSGADLVTIAYGVNDWKYNAVRGDINSAVGDGTICGNMRYIIEKILGDNPLAKIIILTPLNCWGTTKDYGDQSTNYGLGYSFSNSGTLEQVYQALVAVAEYYGLEIIDLTHNSVINRISLPSLLDDGVHPTIPCHTQLGTEIARRIWYEEVK